jgi:tetratricopeptide (TPR) repeat protein
MSESRIESVTPSNEDDFSAEEVFSQGLVLFHRDAYDEARLCFQAAHDANPNFSRARSYLGVCVAICDRRFEEAVALCTSASKQEFFNPEAYLNLARVYLHFGFKTVGRRFLLRGQMIDPANSEISQALGQLGARSAPVLRFLPRRHFINRWLGSARHLIGANEGAQIAA